MRILFLIFFAYLVYRFLIRPIFLAPPKRERPLSPQEQFMRMFQQQMQAQQQGQGQYVSEQEFGTQQQNNSQQKQKQKQQPQNDGEYIDFEELD